VNAERLARQMMATYVATKKFRCAQTGGPVDLKPMVDVVSSGNRRNIGVVPDRSGIEIAVETIAEENGPPVAVGFMADAYGREVSPEIAGSIRRGEIEAAFAAGDMTVTEQLVVSVVAIATAEIVGLVTRYTYRDDGSPKFAQVERGEVVDGAVADVLTALAHRYREEG
jgi:hypothetical protein